MGIYAHFSWLVMISVCYWYRWSLPSLHCCFLETKLLRGAGCVLPHCFLSAGWPEHQPAFVRKQLLSRHSRRSLEVRSFIPCLMKRDVELWLQPAGRGNVGRGVGICFVEQVISGSKPARWLPSYVSTTEFPKPIPQKLGYVRYTGNPTGK